MIKISIGEASKYLGQTTKTLQRWDNDDILPAHHTSGGTRYYYQHELDVMKQLLMGVSRKAAAQQLDVSEKTLCRWDKSGKFKSRYIIGQTSYYHQTDIDRYKKLQKEVAQ